MLLLLLLRVVVVVVVGRERHGEGGLYACYVVRGRGRMDKRGAEPRMVK